jgi:hypothetical protein
MKTKIALTTLVVAAALTWVGCPPCNGPDLQGASIDYEKLIDLSDTSGIVRITGTVRNRGASDFDSGEGQQSLLLFEDTTLVSSVDFEDVPRDGIVQVTFDRVWSTQDEFRPASYTVDITYDPDIFIDGNENNDDCRTSNDDFSRDTTGLDELFN